ncbi:MAG: sulfotransferase domain-containing protein [Thermoclostridium sp.]|nr:sulfotransferase domain-containing protein [Thermoclostridium sp.]
MGNIIWLASYPKSGNTWFRTFLSNLLCETDEEISINNMKTDGIFSSRQIVGKVTGIETTDLTADEIDRLRPAAYHYLAETAEKQLFIKAHDAYTFLEDGTPLMGTVRAKAVYILRNPLDVAVSFSNHLSKDIDTTIRHMGDENFCFCNNTAKAQNQVRQKLLTWSLHAESWTQATALPVHLVRYEDMKMNPLETFAAVVRFIGLDSTREQILQAMEASDFQKLKADEQKNGFKEKPYSTASFFRAGKVGDWREHLTDAQRDRILTDHAAVMRKFGYLDDQGNPVY